MAQKKKSGNLGAKIFFALFGLPFFCVGVFMLYKSGKQIIDWTALQSYERVPARIYSLYVDTNYGDESDTYQLKGSFEYQFNNRIYRSDTITIYDGGDNIGDYHQDTYNKINSSKNNRGEVMAFVNPKNPSEAYLDDTFRWAIIGFNSIFIILFGGFGTLMLGGSFFYKGDDDPAKPEYAATPWRAKKAWKDEGPIYSDGKIKLYAFWGFAVFWNAISSFIPFVIYDEAIKGSNNAAWIAALFPIVGLGLLLAAIRQTFNWRKFGKCPLVLEQFPGVIGGKVKGYIDINTPFDGHVAYKMALKNQYHYSSGSGNSRTSGVRDIWTEYATARAEGSLAGTRIYFDFDVPSGQGVKETEITNDSRYHGWIIHVKADFVGKLDFDRSYDIPVFKKR